MNRKKKLDNETSESVDGNLWTKIFVEIYNENKTKLAKISYSFFFLSSECVRIARLAIQWIPVNSSYQRIKRKSHFLRDSFSVDQIDVFSELLCFESF